MRCKPATSGWCAPRRTRDGGHDADSQRYTPDSFQVREGDQVTLKITNVETIRDMIHGFALPITT
jgi:Nitrous oxide reductase